MKLRVLLQDDQHFEAFCDTRQIKTNTNVKTKVNRRSIKRKTKKKCVSLQTA